MDRGAWHGVARVGHDLATKPPPPELVYNVLSVAVQQSDSIIYVCVYCCCSVTQSCPTLCDPIDCSTPGFPVLHHFLEFAQVHVHLIGDAIQPSHPLCPLLLLPSIFPSIRVFSKQVAQVLELQL